MEEYTLVVMAAGIGTRFGGQKQITPVGPNKEFIMDYSIYDAIKAGFNKVIFIIKKEYEDYFKQTIGARIKDKIQTEYVIQDINDIPEGYKLPKERTKPWGTGHAIYAARQSIKGPFAVINADDFYGYESYEILLDFLKNNKTRNYYLSVCYKVKNTLSDYGDVKRGIVEVKNGVLESIKESSVSIEQDTIVARPLDGSHQFKITDDDLAAVNLFGFTPNFMRTIQTEFLEFLDKNINNLDSEFLIPDIINEEIKAGDATVYVKSTPSKWYGMTYKEDQQALEEAIKNAIIEGKYPKDLWN